MVKVRKEGQEMELAEGAEGWLLAEDSQEWEPLP